MIAMRILAGWDDPVEADLLQLYLAGGGENDVFLATDEDMLFAAAEQPWDVVLHTVTFPTSIESGMAVYTRLQELLPGVPIVVACRPSEIINLPHFLLRGLRFYLYRDAQGDFMFLVLSVLESAVSVAVAEQAQRLAEQLRQEIEGVRTLQEAIIPRGLTAPTGYHAVARYEPSQVTVLGGKPVVLAGGDYYDLFCPDGKTLTALIGDASGHGLKACMSIMTMHTLVRMLATEGYRDTARFVAEINQQLCSNSIVQSGGGFITLLYASLDTTRHEVLWTSAGHPPPLLQRLDTNVITQVGENSDGGPPLGISADMPYDAYSFVMPPRSRLLLYTDGLTDAFPEGGNSFTAFGVNGIRAALESCRDRPLEEALDYLLNASHAFTGGKGRHDDTSLLLLARGA
jgi:serine phosphatase RsbU (regulator of sigma subunit)